MARTRHRFDGNCVSICVWDRIGDRRDLGVAHDGDADSGSDNPLH
jgi:hypothetical protein